MSKSTTTALADQLSCQGWFGCHAHTRTINVWLSFHQSAPHNLIVDQICWKKLMASSPGKIQIGDIRIPNLNNHSPSRYQQTQGRFWFHCHARTINDPLSFHLQAAYNLIVDQIWLKKKLWQALPWNMRKQDPMWGKKISSTNYSPPLYQLSYGRILPIPAVKTPLTSSIIVRFAATLLYSILGWHFQSVLPVNYKNKQTCPKVKRYQKQHGMTSSTQAVAWYWLKNHYIPPIKVLKFSELRPITP